MEEAESVCPAVHHLVEPLLNPQLTNQQFINCAFLERPPSVCILSVLPYSADPTDRRFSKSQDERLASWCVYGILQAIVNQNGER